MRMMKVMCRECHHWYEMTKGSEIIICPKCEEVWEITIASGIHPVLDYCNGFVVSYLVNAQNKVAVIVDYIEDKDLSRYSLRGVEKT